MVHLFCMTHFSWQAQYLVTLEVQFLELCLASHDCAGSMYPYSVLHARTALNVCSLVLFCAPGWQCMRYIYIYKYISSYCVLHGRASDLMVYRASGVKDFSYKRLLLRILKVCLCKSCLV